MRSAEPANTISVERIALERLQEDYRKLEEQKKALEMRVLKSEERRRALMHILSDLNTVNHKLNDQRKAMIHILSDYEQERRSLAQQKEHLDNSRRALMHILQDSHSSNLRLENSRKAMIHIMSDLKETTAEVEKREQELREKQEQLVQAGKLATLGELTTGVAHELNNPLNNIGLFIGNAIDLIELGSMGGMETSEAIDVLDATGILGVDVQGETDVHAGRVLQELHNAMQQVRKATEIISHLRTFGRAASVSYEPVMLEHVVRRSISLMQEQLRLRQIEVRTNFPSQDVTVIGNGIQLEQVFINLLTNARDALASVANKTITITCVVRDEMAEIQFSDTGPGVSSGLEQRIFDPFFTTKEVGAGTGLGLSITYGIIKDHQGTITIDNHPGEGATFLIQLPLIRKE
ncbi:MAG TPA: two-component sensor histidine kinase [Ktedonobacter sp.]|nr:two-component sensor histidine kinase [Ktedonobacter sp.]